MPHQPQTAQQPASVFTQPRQLNTNNAKQGGKDKGKGSNAGKRGTPYSGSGAKLPKSEWLPSPNGSDYCNNFHFRTCNNPNCERDHTCPACGKGQHAMSQCHSI